MAIEHRVEFSHTLAVVKLDPITVRDLLWQAVKDSYPEDILDQEGTCLLVFGDHSGRITLEIRQDVVRPLKDDFDYDDIPF